ALTAGIVAAQMTITGTITGTVVDPTSQVVAGAKITLTSATTGDVRNAEANDVGAFNIVAVQPGIYNVRIQHQGFKIYERRGIGEVKVILNSYQAEYAGNGGAVVQVVSKSGGKEFHGGTYYFLRNEQFNANDFFNNRNSVRRPRYRYNTFGGSIGGPIYIPGK